MEEKDKKLLLIDLCARLPYKVMIKSVGENKIIGLWDLKDVDNLPLPYLRPMSSMTEEEYIEYRTIQGRNCDYGEATICVSKSLYQGLLYDDNEPLKINVYYPNPVIQDWLNAHHFDYRGLITLGLALEAPEGMYSTNNKTM